MREYQQILGLAAHVLSGRRELCFGFGHRGLLLDSKCGDERDERGSELAHPAVTVVHRPASHLPASFKLQNLTFPPRVWVGAPHMSCGAPHMSCSGCSPHVIWSSFTVGILSSESGCLVSGFAWSSFLSVLNNAVYPEHPRLAFVYWPRDGPGSRERLLCEVWGGRRTAGALCRECTYYFSWNPYTYLQVFSV